MSLSLTIQQQHSLREAQPWWPHKPKGADQPHEVLGTLIARKEWTSDYRDEPDAQYVLETADGDVWSIVANTTRLRDEFEEKNPELGDTVSVRFHGMKEPKAADRQPYGDFSVAVERAELPADVAEDEARAQAQADVQAERDEGLPY